uniref:MICOS complex subunit n=1 Tax=Sarcophilus harrisii TaxID=9305 RepID=A0A7N4NXA3_SARHA
MGEAGKEWRGTRNTRASSSGTDSRTGTEQLKHAGSRQPSWGWEEGKGRAEVGRLGGKGTRGRGLAQRVARVSLSAPRTGSRGQRGGSHPDMAAAGMKKLTALTTFAALSVRAVAEEEAPQKTMKPTQLPIYNVPSLHSKYIEEQPGHLQTRITSIRTTACHYFGWCKDVYVWMKNGIMDTVQFGKDAYVYLKNPPQDFLPKIGVITASGLVGFISAKKGSKFKKIAYPLGLTALGASVCYPAQAVVITKVTGKKVYAASQGVYEVLASLWRENYTQKETEFKEEVKVGFWPKKVVCSALIFVSGQRVAYSLWSSWTQVQCLLLFILGGKLSFC